MFAKNKNKINLPQGKARLKNVEQGQEVLALIQDLMT